MSATKAVGYARVSTPEEAEKDLSLPAEIAAIRKHAQDHGLELVGECPATVESTGTEVLPDVVDWHARRDSNP